MTAFGSNRKLFYEGNITLYVYDLETSKKVKTYECDFIPKNYTMERWVFIYPNRKSVDIIDKYSTARPDLVKPYGDQVNLNNEQKWKYYKQILDDGFSEDELFNRLRDAEIKEYLDDDCLDYDY